MANKTKAIMYTRTATSVQSAGQAPDPHLQQSEMCKTYAEQKGFEVIRPAASKDNCRAQAPLALEIDATR